MDSGSVTCPVNPYIAASCIGEWPTMRARQLVEDIAQSIAQQERLLFDQLGVGLLERREVARSGGLVCRPPPVLHGAAEAGIDDHAAREPSTSATPAGKQAAV